MQTAYYLLKTFAVGKRPLTNKLEDYLNLKLTKVTNMYYKTTLPICLKYGFAIMALIVLWRKITGLICALFWDSNVYKVRSERDSNVKTWKHEVWDNDHEKLRYAKVVLFIFNINCNSWYFIIYTALPSDNFVVFRYYRHFTRNDKNTLMSSKKNM